MTDPTPNMPAGPGGPQTRPDSEGPPPVDVSTLPDYEEFQAFKLHQAELAKRSSGEAVLPDSIVLVFGGAEHTYRLVDIDNDVLSHLTVLTTFAENSADKAVALFEALLTPDDFDRLRNDIRPAMRDVRRKHMKDPENAPSISDVWIEMAEAVATPIKEFVADPKRVGSLAGPSPTGTLSNTGSPPSALPSIN